MGNIPFSLAQSIVRICSHPEDSGKTFDDLKSLLISRAYKTKSIEDCRLLMYLKLQTLVSCSYHGRKSETVQLNGCEDENENI